MNLILLGPPGAGKGTQAEFIKNRFHLCKLSTGDMLRAAVKEGTAIGKQADSIMKAGNLVPDDIMVTLIREHILSAQCHDGFILDGFPRTLVQAQALDDMLAAMQAPIKVVIELTVEDESLVERIAGRFSCATCGAGYHDTFKPTFTPAICDICGGTKFSRRKDDTRETVASRLAVYHAQTAPLLPYYAAKNVLRQVDGMADIEAVTQAVESILDLYQN